MTRRRSTEYGGVGQSGYTAGRHEHDPALERDILVHNLTYPRNQEEEAVREELETDDRWTGRGGPTPHEDED